MLQSGKNNFSCFNVGIFIVIIFYGLALYFVPIQSKTFYSDDNTSIVENQAIRTIDIPGIFKAFNTRFLVGLSFALNYSVCKLHPLGYRLINFLIHCLNAFLVYLLVKSTLALYCHPERSEGSKGALRSFGLRPALFASLLFLCHPIQTEPVNFITQRFVLMGTFFYLLTLYLYIQYRCQSKKKYLIISMGAAVAAMFCKEFVVTLPLIITLYEFYFLNSSNETVWKRCRRILPFFVITLIVPVLLLRTPPEAVGVAAIADSNFVQEINAPQMGNHVDITRARGGISRQQYFLTELNVVCTYVRLLFLPVNQNVDYDYPLSNGTGKDILSGLFLLCLMALAVVTYRSYRIISFSILWFFISLSVESSVIPIAHVIAEYRLYLASVGFVFLVMNLIYVRQMASPKINMIAVGVLIGFSILTYQRNKVWENEKTLWNDTIQKSPRKAKVMAHNSRGLVYLNQGKFIEAASEFRKAIEINPDDVEAHINRGIIYYEEGDFTRALSDYNNVIQENHSVAEAYYNRGNVYMKQNNLTGALSDYNIAVELKSGYTEAYANRGSIYVMHGDFIQALSDYNKAIEINPDIAGYYYNRAIVYYELREYVKALRDVHRAEALGAAVNPEFLSALNKAL